MQGSTNYISNEMVRDRETKMKETLKIMGLRPWIYALSFMVQQGIFCIFPCLAMTIFIKVFNPELVDGVGLTILFFSTWLFSLSMLSLAMVFSNFFSSSKLVGMVLNVIFFVPTGIAMSLVIPPGSGQGANEWIQYLFWLPTFPWTVIVVEALKSPLIPFEYFTVDVVIAWVCLALQPFIWFLVHLYLEGVMPDNYGISKPCCFCFLGCGKKRQADAAGQEQEAVAELPPLEKENEVNITNKKRLRRIGTERMDLEDPIKLRRVTMKFGNFKAVDNMSLSIKKNEIMAVLGHNGAGKTTAIYMLTGMLHMTAGEATINGKSVKTAIDEVRQNIGLCQ